MPADPEWSERMNHPIRTNCPRDCYDACGMLVERRDDGSLRVLGDPAHPIARGKLCSKCAVAYNGVWQDASARLTHPLRRIGPRGSGAFERLSWDEALAMLAGRMRKAIDARGGRSILHTHYSGTLSLIGFLFPNRLFNILGASEVDPDTICNAAGHVAWTLLFGSSIQAMPLALASSSLSVTVCGEAPAASALPSTRAFIVAP